MRTIVPRLLPSGHLLCPQCQGQSATPASVSPQTGCPEKGVLVGDRTGCCPGCGVGHYIPLSLARRHNRLWFPNNPGCWNAGDDIEEPQAVESLKIEYTRRFGDSRQRVSIRLRSEGQPLLPGLVRAVQQLAGPSQGPMALEELDEN